MANRRPSGRKADLRWIGSQVALLTVSSGGSSGGAFISSGTTSQTIMRSRGELLVWLDATTSIGDVQGWAAGLIIMPEGTGGTVTSLPLSDPQAPWYLYQTGAVASEAGQVAENDGLLVARYVIDDKAMRVLRPDREVQFVVQTTALAGAQAMNFVLSIRTLIAS